MKLSKILDSLSAHAYWLLLECAIAAFLIWGGIGFDHPGTFGLDFNGFIVIGGVLAVITLMGLIASAVELEWFWFAMHLLFAIAFLTALFR